MFVDLEEGQHGIPPEAFVYRVRRDAWGCDQGRHPLPSETQGYQPSIFRYLTKTNSHRGTHTKLSLARRVGIVRQNPSSVQIGQRTTGGNTILLRDDRRQIFRGSDASLQSQVSPVRLPLLHAHRDLRKQRRARRGKTQQFSRTRYGRRCSGRWDCHQRTRKNGSKFTLLDFDFVFGTAQSTNN